MRHGLDQERVGDGESRATFKRPTRQLALW